MKFQSPQQLKALALLVDGELIGDPEVAIAGVADVRRATAGDITFAENDKFLRIALLGEASAIVVNKTLSLPSDLDRKAILRVVHAQDALNTIAVQCVVNSQTSESPAIHPTAIIGPGTTIAKDCLIGAYSILGANVSIGGGTHLSPNVSIEDDCVIGEGCQIGSHTVIHRGSVLSANVVIQGGCHIGAEPAYYYRLGTKLTRRRAFGSVHIGADVHIGAGCTIARGVSQDTIIGAETKLDCQIHVGHDVEIGRRVVIAAHTGIAGYVRIEDDVIIRGHVAIMQYVTIGKGAELLGKSGVDLDVSEKQLVFGIPATTKERYAQRRRALRRRIRTLEREIKPSLPANRDVQNKVFQTVADEAGKEFSEINSSQILTSDLQFDSLELVELQMALEEEFDLDVVKLRLDTHAFDNIRTVGDVVEIVRDSLTPH